MHLVEHPFIFVLSFFNDMLWNNESSTSLSGKHYPQTCHFMPLGSHFRTLGLPSRVGIDIVSEVLQTAIIDSKMMCS